MIPFLLLLAVGVGQQAQTFQSPPPGTTITSDCHPAAAGGYTCDAPQVHAPAPLKCGKYEYVAYTRTTCLSDGCWDAAVPRYCAPIMHPLKESEYQEIMERLKKLEKDSVRMTEPVIACDDPQNAKGCRWLPNPNVESPER